MAGSFDAGQIADLVLPGLAGGTSQWNHRDGSAGGGQYCAASRAGAVREKDERYRALGSEGWLERVGEWNAVIHLQTTGSALSGPDRCVRMGVEACPSFGADRAMRWHDVVHPVAMAAFGASTTCAVESRAFRDGDSSCVLSSEFWLA